MNKNEVIEEITESVPEEITGTEINESAQSNNEEEIKEIKESPDTPEEAPEDTIGEEYKGSVSDGDSIEFFDDEGYIEGGIASDLVEIVLSAEQNEIFERNNELLENLITVVEKQNEPIMEKQLIDYTVTEGLTLLLVVFALGIVLGRIIGRILPCKI